jgi:hypothetical protein
MQGCAFPAILQCGHNVIAGRKSERIEACDQSRDAPIPLRIGQAQLAIDDGKRVRIPRNATEKAETKIEHAPQPERRLLPRRT